MGISLVISSSLEVIDPIPELELLDEITAPELVRGRFISEAGQGKDSSSPDDNSGSGFGLPVFDS